MKLPRWFSQRISISESPSFLRRCFLGRNMPLTFCWPRRRRSRVRSSTVPTVPDLCRPPVVPAVGVRMAGRGLPSSSVVPSSSSSYLSFWYLAYFRRAMPSLRRPGPRRAAVERLDIGVPSRGSGWVGVCGVGGCSSACWVESSRPIWFSDTSSVVVFWRRLEFRIDI